METSICKYGKYKSSGDEIGYFICRKCSQGCSSAKAFKVAASKKQAADIYLFKKEISIFEILTSVNIESVWSILVEKRETKTDVPQRSKIIFKRECIFAYLYIHSWTIFFVWASYYWQLLGYWVYSVHKDLKTKITKINSALVGLGQRLHRSV